PIIVHFSISWVATRAVWAYRIPSEALVAPRTDISEIATTATKKMAPATSASRRVNPLGLLTPGLIALNLGCSIVEQDDEADERRLDDVSDLDAIGEEHRPRRDRHLPVHVEADREGSRLRHASPRDHHGGVGTVDRQRVAIAVHPVHARRVAHDSVGRVELPEDEAPVGIHAGGPRSVRAEIVALRGALAHGL